jgi:hypothetical protein
MGYSSVDQSTFSGNKYLVSLILKLIFKWLREYRRFFFQLLFLNIDLNGRLLKTLLIFFLVLHNLHSSEHRIFKTPRTIINSDFQHFGHIKELLLIEIWSYWDQITILNWRVQSKWKSRFLFNYLLSLELECYIVTLSLCQILIFI